MSSLKFKDVEKTENGVKSTIFENDMYFVSFNLNKENRLNVKVTSKEFSYPSIGVFYGYEVTINVAAMGSINISEIKKQMAVIERAVETASEIEVLIKHYIF